MIMPQDFWQKLKKSGRPILALAPLAGFTDSAFRQICKSYGADVLYSEMASAAALFYNQKNRHNSTLKLLKFQRLKEKYYVVQLFGANPEHFAVAARLIDKYIQPDGIDINFGCPVPKVTKQGAGAGLMHNLQNSRAVIQAVLANTKRPVSIKIRAGVKDVGAGRFLENISDLPLAAVMIHGRTLQQGFVGEPDWELVRRVRQYFKGVVLANGGVKSLADARRVLRLSRADGLGLARGVLGRPWMFKEIRTGKEITFSLKQIFQVAQQHAALAYSQKGRVGIIELRKHLVWYLIGQPGASQIREQLVKVNNLNQIKKILSVK